MHDDQGNSASHRPGGSDAEGSSISRSDERHGSGDPEQARQEQDQSQPGQAQPEQAGQEQDQTQSGQAKPEQEQASVQQDTSDRARPAPAMPDVVKRDADSGDRLGDADAEVPGPGPVYSGPGYSRPEIESSEPGLADSPAAGGHDSGPGPASPGFALPGPGTTGSGPFGYGPAAPGPAGPGPSGPGFALPGPGSTGSGPYDSGAAGFGQPGAAQPGAAQPGAAPGAAQPGYGQPGGGFPAPPGDGAGLGQPGHQPQPSPGARRRRAFLTYLTVAVVAAAAGAGLTAYGLGGGSNNAPRATGSHQAGPGGGPGGFVPGGGSAGHRISNATVHAAVNAVRPGMVDISSNLAYQGSQAAATGMVITSDGLVLTNNHVINGTTQLYATLLTTGQKFTARWVGYDATDDVAVIRLVGAHNLHPVPLGNSDTVKVGDSVIAIGNAYGANRNPAYVGSITGLNRTITASDSGAANKETLHNMMQINAGIVPGDSGGPLVNTSGRVIGMNTAAATGSLGTTTQNVGFAIPVNRAMRIARQIMSGQSSPSVQIGSTGFLGVLVPSGSAGNATNPAVQRERQLRQDESGSGGTVPQASSACVPTDLSAGVPAKVAPVTSGALIVGQLCGTPADKAGIIAGDVITSVGGHTVTSPQQLTGVMRAFKPGNSVKVVWVDVQGKRHSATLVLTTAPPR